MRLKSFSRRSDAGGVACLPDFLIVGAQKGGTSSLHRYLAQHPDTAAPTKKEVHYFDGGLDPDVDAFVEGTDWYRGHFPGQAPSGLRFESTPLYLFNPLSAARIKALLPDVKLIVLLRDPVERAISHYFHNLRKNHETTPMLDALENEETRLAILAGNDDYKSIPFIHFSYKARGRYAEQLRRYYEHFDRDQIFIKQSEAFFADPAGTVGQALAFLGLPPPALPLNLKALNVGNNKVCVGAEVQAHLRAHFHQPNEDLFDLLGARFDWPSSAGSP